MKNNYTNTVETEKDCLLHMLAAQIMPRCYEYIKLIEPTRSLSDSMSKRFNLFISAFDRVLKMEEALMNWQKEKKVESSYELRHLINEAASETNKILELLPASKDFPEFEDFMHQYWFIYFSYWSTLIDHQTTTTNKNRRFIWNSAAVVKCQGLFEVWLKILGLTTGLL